VVSIIRLALQNTFVPIIIECEGQKYTKQQRVHLKNMSIPLEYMYPISASYSPAYVPNLLQVILQHMCYHFALLLDIHGDPNKRVKHLVQVYESQIVHVST
jgi:hypothetical protein